MRVRNADLKQWKMLDHLWGHYMPMKFFCLKRKRIELNTLILKIWNHDDSTTPANFD